MTPFVHDFGAFGRLILMTLGGFCKELGAHEKSLVIAASRGIH
jgi:hypothetical protein